MTAREQRRAHVLARVIAGELKLWEAAVVLGLSVRQARRLKRALVREGPAALAHANRGRASPRRFSPTLRQHVVRLYQTIYRGLNHQRFCELLAEHEQLQLSVASVRRILRTAGFGSPQTRRPAPHRARRERMPAEGMLLQLDGSPHRWLGPAGPRWSLLGAVDDATGEAVAAVFRDQEDSAGYLLLLRQVVTSRGIPAAVYRDRHSIFRAPGTERLSVEDQLLNTADVLPTQVGRVLAELWHPLDRRCLTAGEGAYRALLAHSPGPPRRRAASGRGDLARAGQRVSAQLSGALPRALRGTARQLRERLRAAQPRSRPGPSLLLQVHTRRVASDNTIRFAGQMLQLLLGRDRLSFARAVVEVHQRLDGSLAVVYQGTLLLHVPAPADAPPLRTTTRGKLAQSPQPPAPPPAPPQQRRKRRQPSLYHPWKQSYEGMRPRQRTLPWIA